MIRCKKCGFTHADPDFAVEDPCILNDPPGKPRKITALRKLRGLPDDCPACLGYGTIERKPVGRARNGQYHLYRMTCRSCGQDYHEEVLG